MMLISLQLRRQPGEQHRVLVPRGCTYPRGVRGSTTMGTFGSQRRRSGVLTQHVGHGAGSRH